MLTSGSDVLYFFSLLDVVEDNPARRGFSCKEGGVGVDMEHLKRLRRERPEGISLKNSLCCLE